MSDYIYRIKYEDWMREAGPPRRAISWMIYEWDGTDEAQIRDVFNACYPHADIQLIERLPNPSDTITKKLAEIAQQLTTLLAEARRTWPNAEYHQDILLCLNKRLGPGLGTEFIGWGMRLTREQSK
jgi:hypothetical protein